MTGFNLDFNDTFEGGKIENGTYEVLITLAGEDAFPSGAEYVDLRLTIRNDIQQPFQNMIVFERIFKAKATGKYNMTMFNTVGKAAQLPVGKTYSNLQGLLDDFINKPLKVTVENKKSDCGKYDNLNVVYGGWEITEFPNVQHVRKAKSNGGNNAPQQTQQHDPFSTGGGPIEVSDDDLPF